MGVLSILFGKKDPKIKEALDAGALIVDVRTPGEFSSGHIKGSKNMPLQQLSGSWKSLSGTHKIIITVCASGIRSHAAKKILEDKGFKVINGGAWQSVESIMN
ncbi:MAG: rhodanese-like domain-containing protein [Chitinophagaceae bacterium]|nr:rhodanese-like domain-containing protein [Bacteroidota bacterium]MCC6259155.1 rhodanese-like domain-containing protein [Chitinophagaceae bacterium]MCW5917066.1 rhodanese-like domain-containing protein [Ferruginibacter sp.]